MLVSAMMSYAQSGSCGDNAYWKLSEKTLTIYGSGATTNYYSPNSIYATYPEWYDYRDEIESVVVEAGINSLGDYSFYEYRSLKSVILPEGLTHIGNYTFAKCSLLDNVTFPSTLESIGDALMNYCNNGHSFENCIALKEISLPENLKLIGGGGFNGCSGLTKVEWNAINCVADVIDPVARYEGIFVGSFVSEVFFGKSVEVIPSQAFQDVGPLSKINTPGTISFVGYNAFLNTTWHRMLESDKVIYIDKTAYSYIVGQRDEQPISVSFKEGTKTVTDHIFQDNKYLEKVEIPSSVENIGENAFKGCENLKEVVWNAASIGDMSGYQGKAMFDSSLKTIVFGNEVTMLPEEFFYGCKSLTEIKLPESLRTIEADVFRGCESITELVIPDNVESLGRTAIYDCANLKTLEIGEGLKSFDSYFFLGGCPNLSELKWNAIEANKDVSASIYHSTDICYAPIVNFIVGDKVEYIPAQLFWESSTLSNVVLGNSVIEIGERAFRECSALTSIKFPETLTTIQNEAFYKSGITDVVIPRNVTSIGTWGFGGNALKRAIFTPNKAPKCNFQDISEQFEIYVPDVDGYGNETFAEYKNRLKPMATTTVTELTPDGIGQEIPFECAIPDYKMSITAKPVLENSEGEHIAMVEAFFEGKENFTATFAYYYKINAISGISSINIDNGLADVYNISGLIVLKDAEITDIEALPAGIYIVKSNGKSSKIIIR